MEEKFICSICHKKVNEVIGFMGSEIKHCYKCHSKKLEQNCAFLREYILNSFSMKDQKRFLDEACKGKYFEEVLNNFKSEEVEQLKNNFDRLIVGIDLLQHGKDYRFRNENNTFYSRQSCCDLTLEETVKELLDELSQTEQSLENFSNKEYELYENVEQLKKENEELKKDLRNAMNLIKENSNAFNKTFEEITNNARIFYEKKDKEFLDLKSAQNKVAIEKLEELFDILNENITDFTDVGKSKYCWLCIEEFNKNFNSIIAELKGGNDE